MIDKLKNAKTNSEVAILVKEIQEKYNISNTKLANIIGARYRSTIGYKIKKGAFFFCEINKLIEHIS